MHVSACLRDGSPRGQKPALVILYSNAANNILLQRMIDDEIMQQIKYDDYNNSKIMYIWNNTMAIYGCIFVLQRWKHRCQKETIPCRQCTEPMWNWQSQAYGKCNTH